MSHERIAVIGRGLMGSAAARHLANAGLRPTLIGPEEPQDKQNHQGVFASHYDEGRITRKNATDPFWANASIASIARYGEIERASGVTFFSDVGALMVGSQSGQFMHDARETASICQTGSLEIAPEDLTRHFPDIHTPTTTMALWEEREAGHISPRRMVEAQTKAATCAGATLIGSIVRGIEERRDCVEVALEDTTLKFDRILVAAGGMTDHVLGRNRQLDVYARTITLFRLTENDAKRLASLPSIVLDTPEGHYILPPIRYPDGHIYMKIGGDPIDRPLTSSDEIGAWFRSGGSNEASAAMTSKFKEYFPRVTITETKTDACMTTWTSNGLPEIAALSSRVSVATGGNGAGAKCSDELGRRGAAILIPEIEERIAS